MLAKPVSEDLIFDGELCFPSEFIQKGGLEDFQKIAGEIRKLNPSLERSQYFVFDLLKKSEFENKTNQRTLTSRWKDLSSLFGESKSIIKKTNEIQRDDFNFDIGFGNVWLVSQICLYQGKQSAKEKRGNNEWVNALLQLDLESGWEGFIIRKDANYRGERSRDILKVKRFQDAEFRVTGVKIGPMTIKEPGKTWVQDVVTALTFNHKGFEVSVGSGLSQEQRINFCKDPKSITGKLITVQYFDELYSQENNSYSLRFPILKFVHDVQKEI